jgi:uncharacterized cupredoxin-like copper-binding protein
MSPLDQPASRAIVGTLGLIAAAAVTGCAGEASSQAGTHATPIVKAAPTRLLLKLEEFAVAPRGNAVTAGDLKLTVINRGKKVHELLVARAGGKLPVMKNGRVDEAALEEAHRVIGEISDVRVGQTASKVFSLKAGRYYLFCNLPGHYGAGMRATLTVRGR